MALIVKVYVPAGAAAEVHRFNRDDPEVLMERGVKPAVTADGSPLTLSPTMPVNPLTGETDTVKLPQLPSTIIVLVGLVERVKSGGPCTTKVNDVLATILPNVPVTVTVYVPTGVVLAVVTLSVDEPAPLAKDVGVRLADPPAGSPLTLKATVLAKPFKGVLVTV